MKNFIKEYGLALWLSLSLAICGFGITTWQYWFIIMPAIIFGVVKGN